METIFTNIKERVLEIPVIKGVSKEKFFNDLGVTYGNFKGKAKEKSLSSDVLAKIVTSFPDINPTWLLTGEGNMTNDIYSRKKEDLNILNDHSVAYLKTSDKKLETQSVPLYNIEAAAGIVTLFNDVNHQHPIDYISIPNLPKCDGAVYVAGDSMYPLLKSGDIIMYKQALCLSNTLFFWGEMYLIGLDHDGDDLVVVKYIQKSEKGDDYVRLVSQNQHHDPIDLHKSKIRALALVKASIRINSMI